MMELTWKARKRIIRLGMLMCVGIMVIVFHRAILQSAGSFLIAEDEHAASQYAVVLGGNSFERGLEAIRLLDHGSIEHVICTGGNVPSVLAALDTVLYEAQITRQFLINEGADSSKVIALTRATSTLEEAYELLEYCETNKIDSLLIISSSFHLRRVRMVFEKVFQDQNVNLLFHGAPPVDYELKTWWKSEAGLIMVNNEYVKYLYYLIRY